MTKIIWNSCFWWGEIGGGGEWITIICNESFIITWYKTKTMHTQKKQISSNIICFEKQEILKTHIFHKF